MEMNIFAENVKAAVEARLGDTYEVSIREVTKNNGTKLTGIMVKSPSSNVAPTLYLEGALGLLNGGADFSDIIDAFIKKYRESEGVKIDVSGFANWESVKDRIFFKLVNKAKNANFLIDAPYTDIIGDLVVEYCLLVDNDEDGMQSVLIHNGLLANWGNPTTKELHDLARKNTPHLFPASVKSMFETLCEMMGGAENLPFDEGDDNMPMTVATNANRVNGAAVILYDGVLADVAEKNDCDLFILPSSIHEVLLLPVNKVGKDVSTLADLVQSVNAGQVAPDEYLSDTVYLYHKDTDSITVA